MKKNLEILSIAAAVLSAAVLQGSNIQSAFAADITLPTASFSNPANGATLSGDAYVKVFANDNVKIRSVKLYVDSSSYIDTEIYSPYEFSIETDRHRDGEHSLRAVVTDTSGNSRTIRISVTFDNSDNSTPEPTGKWMLGVYPIKINNDVRSIVSRHADISFVTNFRLEALDKFPNEQGMLFAESHAAIREGIGDISDEDYDVDYIVYDNERNNYHLSTPPKELVDPALSTNQAMDIIHNAGYKSAISPTRSLLKEEMSGVKWNKVDIVILQMQKVVGDNEFYDLTKKVSQLARPQNSDILIVVQVSPALASNAEIMESIRDVEQYIDGVLVMWNMDNEKVLNDLLTRLGGL
jgi:hypothetical protein